MPDVDKRAAEIGAAVKEADKRRADEAAAFDKLVETMSSFKSTMDSVAARLDSFDAKLEKQNAAEDSGDRDDLHKLKSDGRKPGAAVRSDANARAEEAELAHAQGRAEKVANAFGKRAPPPMQSERPDSYRTRLLMPYQHFSKEFSGVDLATVSGPLLDGIEARIYADAVAASGNPTVPEGTLIERQTRDASGRTISTFYGEPKAWMSQFSTYPGRLIGFNLRG